MAAPGAPVTGARLELDPHFIVDEVHRTGRTARFDTDDPADPGIPEVRTGGGIRSAVASRSSSRGRCGA